MPQQSDGTTCLTEDCNISSRLRLGLCDKHYMLMYTKKHSTRLKQRAHQRYLDNREKCLARAKQWRMANPEKAMLNGMKSAKAWATRYPEKRKALSKRYYLAHCAQNAAYKQYRKQYHKLYYQKNRAKYIEIARLWLAEHPDQAKQTRALWRQNHQSYMAEWYSNHPYARVTNEQQRRARKAGNGGSHTTQEWLDLCARYHGSCLACGKSTKLSRDHIVPIAKGGTNYIDNIQPLCRSCNSRKHTEIIDYRIDQANAV